jgi:hypothetical protein
MEIERNKVSEDDYIYVEKYDESESYNVLGKTKGKVIETDPLIVEEFDGNIEKNPDGTVTRCLSLTDTQERIVDMLPDTIDTMSKIQAQLLLADTRKEKIDDFDDDITIYKSRTALGELASLWVNDYDSATTLFEAHSSVIDDSDNSGVTVSFPNGTDIEIPPQSVVFLAE